MNEKTIATIALRDGEYANLQETLREAGNLLELAKAQGAHLAVLPETVNLLHHGASSAPLEESAFENWQESTAALRETAIRLKLSLVLPMLVLDNGVLANRFYVLASDGSILGYYQKSVPALGEQAAGVEPGISKPIPWEGLRIGGGICIDIYYPHAVFDRQIAAGADLFVIPSMTPGGSFLDYCAHVYGVPFALAYSPWSRILDRDGTELACGGDRSETVRFGFASPVQHATINFNAVTLFADLNQQKMADVQRHYGPRVRIRFDPSNCVFMLESRSPDLSVQEVMREFGLISRRDYFAQLGRGVLKNQHLSIDDKEHN